MAALPCPAQLPFHCPGLQTGVAGAGLQQGYFLLMRVRGDSEEVEDSGGWPREAFLLSTAAWPACLPVWLGSCSSCQVCCWLDALTAAVLVCLRCLPACLTNCPPDVPACCAWQSAAW